MACLMVPVLAACASMQPGPQTSAFAAVVEGNDTTGKLVRIQTQSDKAPRLVTVPFQEQWQWNEGCYHATIQRTVAGADDPGVLMVTFKVNRHSPEVHETALLMGVVDVALCYPDEFAPAQ